MFSCVCVFLFIFFFLQKKKTFPKGRFPQGDLILFFFSSLSLAESNVVGSQTVCCSGWNFILQFIDGIGYSGLLGHLVEVAKHIT